MIVPPPIASVHAGGPWSCAAAVAGAPSGLSINAVAPRGKMLPHPQKTNPIVLADFNRLVAQVQGRLNS